MATLPTAFDGRSDYVGFINRGIPAGGIFAGAEVPKTAEQVAVFGGVAGEQYDPCYHEACDNIDTVTGQPPADTMNCSRRTRRSRRAGGRAPGERAEVAQRDVGRRDARGLVLRARQGHTPATRGDGQRGEQEDQAVPVQVPGAS